MDDKTFKDQKKRVKKYFDKWFPTLGMGWFRVGVEYYRSSETIDVIATTSCRWQYRHALIRYNLEAVEKISDDELETAVIHEFIHILANPLFPEETADKELIEKNEYAVTCLTEAIKWSHMAGQKSKNHQA